MMLNTIYANDTPTSRCSSVDDGSTDLRIGVRGSGYPRHPRRRRSGARRGHVPGPGRGLPVTRDGHAGGTARMLAIMSWRESWLRPPGQAATQLSSSRRNCPAVPKVPGAGAAASRRAP